MTRAELDRWKAQAGVTNEYSTHANRLDYTICVMPDHWHAILEYDSTSGNYIPLIQAQDAEHVKSYITLREPVTVPVQVI